MSQEQVLDKGKHGKYTHKIYGTSRFYVAEDLYSIEELETMLDRFKKAQQHRQKMLSRSMKIVEDQITCPTK